jgi:histone deacetylase 11
MKWATAGTILAAREALLCHMAFNLSGGYHHAEEEQGDGFCIYSDVAVAISALRFEEQLHSGDQIVIIDLDAHQGNGLERIYMNDASVHFFDLYNADIYPEDDFAKTRINCNLPIVSGTDGYAYLQIVEDQLEPFLDRLYPIPKLAFYLAGTDVYEKDPLGDLKLSSDQILRRDLFVVSMLRRHGIPLVMLLSGGYTRQSYQIVSQSIGNIIASLGWLNNYKAARK